MYITQHQKNGQIVVARSSDSSSCTEKVKNADLKNKVEFGIEKSFLNLLQFYKRFVGFVVNYGCLP